MCGFRLLVGVHRIDGFVLREVGLNTEVHFYNLFLKWLFSENVLNLKVFIITDNFLRMEVKCALNQSNNTNLVYSYAGARV